MKQKKRCPKHEWRHKESYRDYVSFAWRYVEVYRCAHCGKIKRYVPSLKH